MQSKHVAVGIAQASNTHFFILFTVIFRSVFPLAKLIVKRNKREKLPRKFILLSFSPFHCGSVGLNRSVVELLQTRSSEQKGQNRVHYWFLKPLFALMSRYSHELSLKLHLGWWQSYIQEDVVGVHLYICVCESKQWLTCFICTVLYAWALSMHSQWCYWALCGRCSLAWRTHKCEALLSFVKDLLIHFWNRREREKVCVCAALTCCCVHTYANVLLGLSQWLRPVSHLTLCHCTPLFQWLFND